MIEWCLQEHSVSAFCSSMRRRFHKGDSCCSTGRLFCYDFLYFRPMTIEYTPPTIATAPPSGAINNKTRPTRISKAPITVNIALYIRTDTDEFVIKQVEPSGEWYKCTGTLNVEELEGKQYPQGFETVEKTVDECLTEAIDGTGWKVIRCDVSKKRTIRIEQNCSAWDVAQQAITTYRCEMVFDSLNKGISVYEKCGEDRGAYFIERLNLKRLQVQSNSYDFATRLIPIGKDGLMLNIDGKNYVENHQYSKKVKTMTWKDERYTDAESLKEDAEAKLDELSKPYRSYTAEIINLVEAVQDEEKKEQYKEVFSIALGDTVLLISKSTGIRESHRIVKFYEYPLTKEKNKVELANTRLSFEEVQRTEQELS